MKSKIIGCAIGYVLLGMIVALGMAIALAIVGSSNFIELIFFLALLICTAYLFLRGDSQGDTQRKFDVAVRIAVGVLLLESMVIGGVGILKIAGVSTLGLSDFLLPIGIIFSYETLKLGLKMGRENHSPPIRIKKAPLVLRSPLIRLHPRLRKLSRPEGKPDERRP